MEKILSRVAFVFIAASFLVAAPPARAQDAPAERVRLLLDWTTLGSHAWVYLAEAKGYFKEAGLTVTVAQAKGGNAAAQQIGADQADVGFAPLSAMMAAKSAGLSLISVAGYARAGDLGVLAPKELGIKTLKDLEGKRLAYPASGTAGPLMEPFLKAGGTSPDKLTVVNVDVNALINVYLSGNVDAVLTSYGMFGPIADEKRPSDTIMMSSVGMILPGDGLMVNQKLLPQRAKLIAKFVPAADRAWTYIFDNHVDEAVDITMTARAEERLDRKLLRGQLLAYMSEFATPSTTGKPLGWQTDEDWTTAIKVLEGPGVIKPGTKPADYYTNEFIRP